MKINFITIIFLLLNCIISQYTPMDKPMEQPFINYITVSRQGLLLPNRVFKKSENPKISIIILMYNEAKNAKSVIRSIQNQNL